MRQCLEPILFQKKRRDKTVEFLLVKPISRSQMITSKLLAAFLNIVIFNVITFISSVVMVQKYAEGEEVVGDISL